MTSPPLSTLKLIKRWPLAPAGRERWGEAMWSKLGPSWWSLDCTTFTWLDLIAAALAVLQYRQSQNKDHDKLRIHHYHLGTLTMINLKIHRICNLFSWGVQRLKHFYTMDFQISYDDDIDVCFVNNIFFPVLFFSSFMDIVKHLSSFWKLYLLLSGMHASSKFTLLFHFKSLIWEKKTSHPCP